MSCFEAADPAGDEADDFIIACLSEFDACHAEGHDPSCDIHLQVCLDVFYSALGADGPADDALDCQVQVQNCYDEMGSAAECEALGDTCRFPEPTMEDCMFRAGRCFDSMQPREVCQAIADECSTPAESPDHCDFLVQECYERMGEPGECEELGVVCHAGEPRASYGCEDVDACYAAMEDPDHCAGIAEMCAAMTASE